MQGPSMPPAYMAELRESMDEGSWDQGIGHPWPGAGGREHPMAWQGGREQTMAWNRWNMAQWGGVPHGMPHGMPGPWPMPMRPGPDSMPAAHRAAWQRHMAMLSSAEQQRRGNTLRHGMDDPATMQQQQHRPARRSADQVSKEMMDYEEGVAMQQQQQRPKQAAADGPAAAAHKEGVGMQQHRPATRAADESMGVLDEGPGMQQQRAAQHLAAAEPAPCGEAGVGLQQQQQQKSIHGTAAAQSAPAQPEQGAETQQQSASHRDEAAERAPNHAAGTEIQQRTAARPAAAVEPGPSHEQVGARPPEQTNIGVSAVRVKKRSVGELNLRPGALAAAAAPGSSPPGALHRAGVDAGLGRTQAEAAWAGAGALGPSSAAAAQQQQQRGGGASAPSPSPPKPLPRAGGRAVQQRPSGAAAALAPVNAEPADCRNLPIDARAQLLVEGLKARSFLVPLQAIDCIKPQESYVLNFDGTSRGHPGWGGCAAVISSSTSNVVVVELRASLPFGTCLSEIEYGGATLGLLAARNLGIKRLMIRCTSRVFLKQMSNHSPLGLWNACARNKCYTERMKPFHLSCMEVLRQLDEFSLHEVPRESNMRANELAHEAVNVQVDT